jgi:hypothetical protein
VYLFFDRFSGTEYTDSDLRLNDDIDSPSAKE